MKTPLLVSLSVITLLTACNEKKLTLVSAETDKSACMTMNDLLPKKKITVVMALPDDEKVKKERYEAVNNGTAVDLTSVYISEGKEYPQPPQKIVLVEKEGIQNLTTFTNNEISETLINESGKDLSMAQFDLPESSSVVRSIENACLKIKTSEGQFLKGMIVLQKVAEMNFSLYSLYIEGFPRVLSGSKQNDVASMLKHIESINYE